MKKGILKKALSMLLVSGMVVGTTSVMTGCGSKEDEVITLDVYSQLANSSGLQTGWSADLMLEKFNVKLNIIPDADGVFETRMESGDLGDIVIWANDNDKYPLAVKNELLYDWEEDDLLSEYGPVIEKNMPDALQKNRNLTSKLTDGKRETLYGFGGDVATTSEDHQSFFYTWDVRWDLYKQLGYPEVKDLQDFRKLLKDMQKICPKDDAGNKVYAVSLWPDWDDAMSCMLRLLRQLITDMTNWESGSTIRETESITTHWKRMVLIWKCSNSTMTCIRMICLILTL